MATTKKAADLKLVRTDNAPVQIHGEHGRLHGTLNLQNQSASRLTLRSIPIEASKIKGMDATALSAMRVRGRLSPNEQGEVRIDFEIDPTTPPGVYKAKLMIGDEAQAAEINIAENFELDISPDTITLNAAAKQQLTRELTITNVGNVDVQLGDRLVVPIKSDCMLENALQRGIAVLSAKRSREELQLQDVLAAVGEQLAGPMTLLWQKTKISPGESKVISAKIELPDNLQPHAYYYAEVELYSGSLRLDIYT